MKWEAHSAHNVLGYNVYRGGKTGGPYARLNFGLLANPDYVDSGVAGGKTYYYVVTAVSPMSESSPSSEVVAAIPSP